MLWWQVFSVILFRLYWEDRFLMWLRKRQMLLRLFVNINVSVGSILVCSTTIGSVYNYALRNIGISRKTCNDIDLLGEY